MASGCHAGQSSVKWPAQHLGRSRFEISVTVAHRPRPHGRERAVLWLFTHMGPLSRPPRPAQLCGRTCVSTHACPHSCVLVTMSLRTRQLGRCFWALDRSLVHSPAFRQVSAEKNHRLLPSHPQSISFARGDQVGARARVLFVSRGDTEAPKEAVPHSGCPAQEDMDSPVQGPRDHP